MLDDDCTTDAMPSPPRTRKEYPPKQNKRKPESPESDDNEENERPFTGNPRAVNNQAVIYISNSKRVHVGHVKHYFINGPPNQHRPVKETEKIRTLKNSNKAVTRTDINELSQHFSVGWEASARALGFSDGQIYSFEYRHNSKNLRQTLYDLLCDWIEYKGPDEATVGVLAQTLWKTEQKQAVKLWSEIYEKIH